MKRHLLPYLLSVLSFIACSGAETGPDVKDSKFKTEAAFCREWAIAACNDRVVSACNGTRTGCIETQRSACQVVVPLGYDPKHAQDCLDTVKRAYADAELTAEELEVVLRLGGDCMTLVDGGLTEGDVCTSSFECDGVNGFECVIKPGEIEGSCRVPVPAGLAEPCEDPEVVCDEAFYCVDSADGPVCLNRKASGSCTSDFACQSELRCEIPTDAPAGACTARTPNGDPCVSDRDCLSGMCLGVTDTDPDKICLESIILTVRDPLCRDLR